MQVLSKPAVIDTTQFSTYTKILALRCFHKREQYEQSRNPALVCSIHAGDDDRDRQHQGFELGFAKHYQRLRCQEEDHV
jgi:hypothetical protein